MHLSEYPSPCKPRRWMTEQEKMSEHLGLADKFVRHFRVSFTRAKGFITPFTSESICHSQAPAPG